MHVVCKLCENLCAMYVAYALRARVVSMLRMRCMYVEYPCCVCIHIRYVMMCMRVIFV